MPEQPECTSASLISSSDGGAVLTYLCECGAILTRTREQAETDALPSTGTDGDQP